MQWGLRATAAALACALLTSALFATSAFAEESGGAGPPDYDGIMQFPTIYSPAGPEDYPFHVEKGPRLTLKQAGETEIDLVYEDGLVGVSIVAETAYDAAGTQVPTTVEITGSEEVTLVVHHREGAYDYPITAGPKPETGHSIPISLPTWEPGPEYYEALIKAENPAAPVTEVGLPRCTVPDLVGLGRREAAGKLRAAHCSLGAVRHAAGATASGKVVKQFHPAGSDLAAGAPVAIKLGRR